VTLNTLASDRFCVAGSSHALLTIAAKAQISPSADASTHSADSPQPTLSPLATINVAPARARLPSTRPQVLPMC